MKSFLCLFTLAALLFIYSIDCFAQSDTLVIKLKNNTVQDSIITSDLQKIAFGYITVPDQEINLSTGWNMISSFVETGNPLMDSVWQSIRDSVVIVKNNNGEVFIPSYYINNIGDWNVTQGYQVYMQQNKTLVLWGNILEPEFTTVNLTSGWNMISYLRDSELDCETAFAGLAEGNLVIVKDNYGNVYIPSYGINTIGYLLPGQGYQVYVLNNDIIIYPGN
jgi:hypothetical protein